MKMAKSFLILFITLSLIGCANDNFDVQHDDVQYESIDRYNMDIEYLEALVQLKERGSCCQDFSEFSYIPIYLNQPKTFYIRDETNQAYEFDDGYGLSYLAAIKIPEIEDNKTYRLSVDSFVIQLRLEEESKQLAQYAIFRPSLLLLDKDFNTVKKIKHLMLERPIKYFYDIEVSKEDKVEYIVVFSKRRLFGQRDFGMSPKKKYKSSKTYNEDVAYGIGMSQYGAIGGLIYADIASYLNSENQKTDTARGYIYSPVGHVELTLSEIVEE